MRAPLDLAAALADYAAQLYDRAADDLADVEKHRANSLVPDGFAAGYAAGRNETVDSVAAGLRRSADLIRERPELSLDPPEVRLS